MSVSTKLLSELIKRSFSIPIEITYWDGSKQLVGEGENQAKIIFNKPLDFNAIKNDASLALAEAYMDRDIEVEGDLQAVITDAFNQQDSFLTDKNFQFKFPKFRRKNKKTNTEDIHHHYDVGNEFYQYWLDETMTYSSAYFHDENDTLEDAQRQKIDVIFNKLRLNNTDHVLDIGCGWGTIIFAAAEEYGAKATGVTLSEEQYNYVSEQINERGLEDLVTVRLEDYRDLAKHGDKFSKIVSVGMFEHVGKENLSEYFETIKDLLEEFGFALIQGISSHRDMRDEDKGRNAFILKYIFPGGYIPSVAELVDSITKIDMKLIDLESLRRHYQLTLEEWHRRFRKHWDEIAEDKDERFMRMWELYLQSCASIFEAGRIDTIQYLIEKGTDNTRPLKRDYMLDN